MKFLKVFLSIINILTPVAASGASAEAEVDCASGDSIVGAFSAPMQWRIGGEVAPAYVVPTHPSLTGDNLYGDRVYASLAGTMRCDFSFNARSREGMLYSGLYQGVGVDMRTFFAQRYLGSPVSVYVYQGAPVKHFGEKLWLGYEWRFGAAMNWADRTHDFDNGFIRGVISTRVTAHMGVGLKLWYAATNRWHLCVGFDVLHFSNGNTSFPNSGINQAGLSVGASYVLNPQKAESPSVEMETQADKGRWMYDILVYGAWRRRVLEYEDTERLLKGRYAVAGLQFTPMRKLNRYFAVGAALDVKYDRSTGLVPYWRGGHYSGYYYVGEFDRVPFGKQLSVGLAAVGELTMPIFSVSAGVGYDVLSPVGENRFFQILAVKAFITRNLYLNAGYRLGNFKTPHNLMLGVGFRSN